MASRLPSAYLYGQAVRRVKYQGTSYFDVVDIIRGPLLITTERSTNSLLEEVLCGTHTALLVNTDSGELVGQQPPRTRNNRRGNQRIFAGAPVVGRHLLHDAGDHCDHHYLHHHPHRHQHTIYIVVIIMYI